MAIFSDRYVNACECYLICKIFSLCLHALDRNLKADDQWKPRFDALRAKFRHLPCVGPVLVNYIEENLYCPDRVLVILGESQTTVAVDAR